LPLTLTDLAEPYLITGAGDVIRVYDISSLKEPELIHEVDAHWHDVTALRLWIRKSVGADKKTRIEPYIVSTSLDGTIRKWRLSGMLLFFLSHYAYHFDCVDSRCIRKSDLLNPVPVPSSINDKISPSAPATSSDTFKMTEDEERELAELLGSDQ
jgi:WD40 repeat protein